jgi:hypothetical protein
VLAAATPRGAVPGLARDSGRHAQASVRRSPPNRAEPSPDSPAMVGGAHRKDTHGHAALPPASPWPNYAHCVAIGPCKTRAEKKVGTLAHRRLAPGQTARFAPLQGQPQIWSPALHVRADRRHQLASRADPGEAIASQLAECRS